MCSFWLDLDHAHDHDQHTARKHRMEIKTKLGQKERMNILAMAKVKVITAIEN